MVKYEIYLEQQPSLLGFVGPVFRVSSQIRARALIFGFWPGSGLKFSARLQLCITERRIFMFLFSEELIF